MLKNLIPSMLVACAFNEEHLNNLEAVMSSGSNKVIPSCQSFEPMLTNRGICHTFNAVPFSEIGNLNDEYISTFQKVYYPASNENNGGRHISDTARKLKFILDSNVIDR